MPILLAADTGVRPLTSSSALTWLQGAGLQLPDHVDEDGLDLFVETRTKVYRETEGQAFIGDLEAFLQVRMSIRLALRNLTAYEEHLEAQQVTSGLVRELLGVKSAKKLDGELQEHVERVVNELLDEELDYVEECRASLHAQLDWHSSGTVDKGAPTSRVLEKALTALNKNTAKDEAKLRYYEPMRALLMGRGFVVSPPGTPLGAIFPASDWVRDIQLPGLFERRAKALTDELVQRYQLLGDDRSALTRMLKPPPVPPGKQSADNLWKAILQAFVSAVGCLCVSWTRHEEGGRTVYVPVLGLSGVVQEAPNERYFSKYCRHLALPTWEPDPAVDVGKAELPELEKEVETAREKVKKKAAELSKLGLMGKKPRQPKDEDERSLLSEYARLDADRNDVVARKDTALKKLNEELAKEAVQLGLWVNYDEMIRRTNVAAVGYRARELLRLRKPARQALLSYVSFRENKAHESLIIEGHPVPTLKDRAVGVDLWICGWHSLNCAEPAALMTASSFFCEGTDVVVCFPYEGLQDTGPFRNRPKETCAWCASVELGFRSLSRNPGQVDASKQSGQWLTQLTIHTLAEPSRALPSEAEFDAFDDTNPVAVSTRRTLSGTLAGFGLSLVKNNNLDDRAYSDVVETKIGRVRSMYHMLGLLDPLVIALDRPLFGRSKSKGPGSSISSGRGRRPRPSQPPSKDKDKDKGTSSKVGAWSKKAEAQVRYLAAAKLYNADVHRNYALTENPGGGDCMYYAFADGLRRNARVPGPTPFGGERIAEAMTLRENAAEMTARLIQRGVGISPGMFRDMAPSGETLQTLALASESMDQLRLDAWAEVRLRRALGPDFVFSDTDPRYPQFVALAESYVVAAINRDGVLRARLNALAEAYEAGQRRRRQWAGDLDFRGLVLSNRVNLRMHYVDASDTGIQNRNGHRVDTYNFQELWRQYFGTDVMPSGVTIDIFHVNDNHYVFGRRL
ncbi:hypothetical protein NR800_18035 [Corallococcus interemptor]|uniref:hypothetical protein n=1 Tax=Corallococcus interemptor TaxID=2316720 RepID=UPI0035D3DE69